MTLFACLPLPSLFVRYAHLTVMISMSCERGLLWLRHEPLQSLALRFGTNSFLLLDLLYYLVSQMPPFVLSRLLSSLWVSRTGSTSDWCALQEALYKCIDTIQYNTHTRRPTHVMTHTHKDTTHYGEVILREAVFLVSESTRHDFKSHVPGVGECTRGSAVHLQLIGDTPPHKY